MKKALVGAVLLSSGAFAQDAARTLDAAAKAMGITNLTSIEYTGSGSAYNFGQAMRANLPWPQQFIFKNYVADVDYSTPALREEMYRLLPDGSVPGGFGPTMIQFMKGNDAWNVTGVPPVPGPATRFAGAGNPFPATLAERQLAIWLTPPGFVKGAQANHPTQKGKVITFMTPDHHKIVGTLDAQKMIVKTETWIDSPVVGDMPIETIFSNYKDFDSVKFPTTISQSQGGHLFLQLTVSEVKSNAAVAFDVPNNVKNASAPVVRMKSEQIGDGIWYVTGSAQHSLVAEFNDYVVLIESPLDEANESAVIAEAHKLVPNKPIKYSVNTHNGFDHSGGVRTAAAEGAIIVTPASNKAYYEKIFANPHTLNPDKLAQSKKKAKVEGVQGKRVLTDGTHEIDLYVQPIDDHNDAMMLIYFPREKILSEADAFSPPPQPAAAAPAKPNPWSVQLYNEIQQLHLDVDKIAPIHNRMTSLAELKKMIGKSSN